MKIVREGQASMSKFLNSISAFIARHVADVPQDSAAADPALPQRGDGAPDGQLPLMPFPPRQDASALPKLRPSRALTLQRASTSVALPSRTVLATRTHPARAHESLEPTLTLTETERARLQVMQVQIRLHSLALYDGPIDGMMNPETVTGVRHFQTLKGQRPTGTLAVGTLSALGVRAIG
jgi:hypothetical protein